MGLSVGITGLPNVGKSTLLNALTHAGAEASNYPFCTIDQNIGVAPVPDPDLGRLEQILEPEQTLPTTVRFVDIAGLVAGASRGEGLGNKFLGHVREVDAILHVVRCFENDDVAHSTGEVDPVRDVEIVETEFLLADLDSAQRALQDQVKVFDSIIKMNVRLKEAPVAGESILPTPAGPTWPRPTERWQRSSSMNRKRAQVTDDAGPLGAGRSVHGCRAHARTRAHRARQAGHETGRPEARLPEAARHSAGSDESPAAPSA